MPLQRGKSKKEHSTPSDNDQHHPEFAHGSEHGTDEMSQSVKKLSVVLVNTLSSPGFYGDGDGDRDGDGLWLRIVGPGSHAQSLILGQTNTMHLHRIDDVRRVLALNQQRQRVSRIEKLPSKIGLAHHLAMNSLDSFGRLASQVVLRSVRLY